MVVYAAAVDVSVGACSWQASFPGLMAGCMLMLAIYGVGALKNMAPQPCAGFGEDRGERRGALWGLLLIVIILGGIYGGIFTPTEAAAVAAVYAFLIANFVYRDMGPLCDETTKHSLLPALALITAFFHKDTRNTLVEAGKLTIMLLFIIANALILKHVLTDEQIPQSIAERDA